MFEIFKEDIKAGDKVKLYLTTGKEPIGTVLEIGPNFVLLKTEENTQNRFFDKLIGGWDLINKSSIQVTSNSKINKQELESKKTPQNELLATVNQLKSTVQKSTLKKRFEANATILEVKNLSVIVETNDHNIFSILLDKVADKTLLSLLQHPLETKIPVLLSYFEKNGKKQISALSVPNTIEGFIDKCVTAINSGAFDKALLFLSFVRSEIKSNVHLGHLITRTKTLAKKQETKTLTNSQTKHNGNNTIFKNVEKEINNLIRESKFEFAISQIENELKNDSITDKYRSSLLLKKAQIFSAINNPTASEYAYQSLILFNEKIKAPPNNLSHLYTELARIQALKVDKQLQALESVKRALEHNPNNNFALNLLKQFEGKSIKSDFSGIDGKIIDEHLLIEADDDTTTISKMIDLDIKEYKYAHPEIIRNGGKPTAFIAKSILNEAKKTRETDLSERYPIYLEAAKAFSELNVGSYDLQDYLESAAYYSMLKGNSLYINFRNNIFHNELDILKLTRLRDSACSYFRESLNLLSNIEPKLLLTILANYLKLNILVYHVRNKSQVDFRVIFKSPFSDVFASCLQNKNRDIETIAYDTVLSCGAASIHAWNKLAQLPKGTGRLYDEFRNEKNKERIFNLINKLEASDINPNLSPGEFLKATFQRRRKKELSFIERISKVINIDLEPHTIDAIIHEWGLISEYEGLLSETDRETKFEVDKVLSILQPYLNRSQAERTNILIQARNIVEKQVKFINDNSTYFGRTFIYRLLIKWKREIDVLLEEKITQSYPALEVLIDPPYYVVTNGEITAPLIIRNIGKATAEGFQLKIICESTEYEERIEFPFQSNSEIASDGKLETVFAIPEHIFSESKAVEIKIDISAVYQKKLLPAKHFEYTVEEEPKSTLTYEDIPWRDGPIPPEQLFKGRKKLIADLAQHYLSIERDKPYILYGLTRTGKSSILEYLRKNIEGDTFVTKGREMMILTFGWDLSEAASYKKASDFWKYILYQQTYEEFEKFAEEHQINIKEFNLNENVRAKDFKIILEYLNSKNIYPIFFVDEFSFIKTLIDDNTINTAFLHTLRQFSLNELASFIFAGTYDIKSLIKDPEYGITGQLVNAIEEQINEISDEAAEELIEVINDKLSFTPEAIHHIKFLSGNVPYFIQILCKYCGYFAAENKRRYIGYPELEKVVKILIGQEPSSPKSLVKKLPENTFQNNQFSPADSKEVAVLISSIAYLNKNRIEDPRGIGFSELQKLWADRNISSFRPKLADAINLLKEKKIITQTEDEGVPVYKLSVDLFRRWWANHNQDIVLTLTTLTE